MPRPPRADEAGGLHHALNRGHLRAEIFHKDAARYHTRGMSHVYQQRDKSFPIQDDEHFFVVCRYVERNALRAGLAKRAEDWRWGSLWRWLQKLEPNPRLLSPWPLGRLVRWVERVNEPLTDNELAACRLSAQRGKPLGDEGWVESLARRLNLESTMRPRGRKRVRFSGQPNKEA
ncbi:hypothetical protein RISK_006723 [Rhodopirellula islandica]|uniref:Transposase n=1 Tax=Rhodopirellula islandica TaxID=595434 RepID=A0A0J1E6R9_RHOIS|nr:hypothetical protein [Rhodopirellula islandica]KLU01154.1 hypothetical protein RISK_006723 [Rhodopirellula islandica]